jgi:hypothetical protein
MTHMLDQNEAEMVDALLGMAADHDHLEQHEATAALLIRLLAEPGFCRIALATGVATLALRLHRSGGPS